MVVVVVVVVVFGESCSVFADDGIHNTLTALLEFGLQRSDY
jgi:hypothetical protein